MTTNPITTESVRAKLLSEFASDKDNLTAQELFLYSNVFNILSFIDESREDASLLRSEFTKRATKSDDLGYRILGVLDEKTRNWTDGISRVKDLLKQISYMKDERGRKLKNQ